MVNTSEKHQTIFQGKDLAEHFQFYFRQHWIRMLWPFSKAVLLTLAIFATGYFTLFVIEIESPGARRLLIGFLFLFLLVVQFEFLIRFYRHFLYVTVITDRRAHRIKKTLMTMDEHECVDLWALQEITKIQRGPLQTLLNFGSLKLEAQDTHLTFHFVPQIGGRYQAMMKLWEKARRAKQSGVRS